MLIFGLIEVHSAAVKKDLWNFFAVLAHRWFTELPPCFAVTLLNQLGSKTCKWVSLLYDESTSCGVFALYRVMLNNSSVHIFKQLFFQTCQVTSNINYNAFRNRKQVCAYTSCSRPGLSSSAQSSGHVGGWGGDAGVCVKASTSLSLHYQAPWDSLRVIKSHSHWQRKLLGSYLDLLISLLFLHQKKSSHTCRKTRSAARCVSLIQAARGLTIIQQHTVQLACNGVHSMDEIMMIIIIIVIYVQKVQKTAFFQFLLPKGCNCLPLLINLLFCAF